ncbi:MAG TPA: ABC transporter permease, partial [Streptosporangiaceae bacterium]|nr:ABC transporter permease [Streptosporangiaceae bacterium]
MLIWELWMVALAAIRANKLRSFLTMLGIIIGVGAVITMIALGSGAQKAVQDNISALGTNLLTVMPGQQFQHGVASDQRVGLTVDDATEIQNTARHLVAVMPEINRSFQVKYRNLNANIQVTGTSPSYFKARSYTVVAGRVFTAGDDEARRRVAVIGSAVGDDFGQNGAAMIGQSVEIRGITFEIIGLLGAKGAQQGWMNPDEQIFVPLNTARYRVMGSDRVRTITVKVDDERNMSVAMISLEQAVRRRHKIQPSAANDFQIRNQADLAATLSQTTETFT